MKSLIPFEIKYRLRELESRFLKSGSFRIPKSTTGRVFFFLAADYGNIGDLAITHAQIQFIERCLPEKTIVEIPISQTLGGLNAVSKVIQGDDMVVIVGGGNMGDRYPQIEAQRQSVINRFKNNRIICFPQTCEYSNTPSGKKALTRARRVYQRRAGIKLFARDVSSLKLLNEEFPKCQTAFCPDIVLSIGRQHREKQRTGIVSCLRDDKEKALSAEDRAVIQRWLDGLGEPVEQYDTHIKDVHVPSADRWDLVNKYWTRFSQAELVITDRLHGMIFAAITETPCIAIPNLNKKVEESCEFIDLPYVKLLTRISTDCLENSRASVQACSRTFPDFDECFEALRSTLCNKQ